MSTSHPALVTLLAHLRTRPTASAAEIGAALGVSQPTVSRLIAAAGDQVARIGKARSARYAATRTIGRNGSAWPLYRLDGESKGKQLGVLQALHDGGYLFTAEVPCPAFFIGQYRDGHYPGLPWFIDDQRPQGFLGRAFARRVASETGANAVLDHWTADDYAIAILQYSADQPGDLVLGDAAYRRAVEQILAPTDAIDGMERERTYPRWADEVMAGGNPGSSAGGEQPKFTATLDDGGRLRPVIVKFSERADTDAARRWADLLRCEHIAGRVMRAHGLPAAHSRCIEADGRVFLESERFDRGPDLWRRGFVSLAALDADFYGHGRIAWWQFARQLHHDGWLTADDARQLRIASLFGELIGNSDMHLGNAALVLNCERPFALAPMYDMLPMLFRPGSGGEIVPRQLQISLPTPDLRAEWMIAAAAAQDFWAEVLACPQLTAGFVPIAQDALDKVTRAHQLLS